MSFLLYQFVFLLFSIIKRSCPGKSARAGQSSDISPAAQDALNTKLEVTPGRIGMRAVRQVKPLTGSIIGIPTAIRTASWGIPQNNAPILHGPCGGLQTTFVVSQTLRATTGSLMAQWAVGTRTGFYRPRITTAAHF